MRAGFSAAFLRVDFREYGLDEAPNNARPTGRIRPAEEVNSIQKHFPSNHAYFLLPPACTDNLIQASS